MAETQKPHPTHNRTRHLAEDLTPSRPGSAGEMALFLSRLSDRLYRLTVQPRCVLTVRVRALKWRHDADEPGNIVAQCRPGFRLNSAGHRVGLLSVLRDVPWMRH